MILSRHLCAAFVACCSWRSPRRALQMLKANSLRIAPRQPRGFLKAQPAFTSLSAMDKTALASPWRTPVMAAPLQPLTQSYVATVKAVAIPTPESQVAKTENLIVCLGPGTFSTLGNYDFIIDIPHTNPAGFTIGKGWKIHGAGKDKTTLKLSAYLPITDAGNPRTFTCGYRRESGPWNKFRRGVRNRNI